MQTPTLLQKVSFGWLSWHSILPILALLVGLGTSSSALAQAVVDPNGTLAVTTVLISANGSANVAYDANNQSANTDFNGANLGNFDVNTGQLVLRGATASTTEPAANTISSLTLYYSINVSNFIPVPLAQTTVITNADGSRTRTFELSTAAQSLLANATAAGSYSVSVYLQASGVTSDNKRFDIYDDRGRNYYTATFIVTGTPTIVSVWTGQINDNWFDPRNWNNGIVPSATTNAVIPNLALNANSTAQYPNIYSNVMKPPTQDVLSKNPDGTSYLIPGTPGFDNSTSGNAQVKDITLQANSPVDRSILRLVVGRLDVFGNFNNPIGSFIQRGNTVISFKGDDQTISGSTNGFSSIEIDGGVNGVKTLTNNFVVKAGGSLKFIHGILQTNSSQISTNFVTLAGPSVDEVTQEPIPAAQLVGETETSFFRGYMITTQPATLGESQDFSNIGLTLTFKGTNAPGDVQVTRTTDTNNLPRAFGGTTPKPGIRRVFGVQPTSSASLRADVKFRYLTNELFNLRTDNGSNGSVDQNKLALYVSSKGGDGYSQYGVDSNTGNELVKTDVTTFATITLSEQQTPLPVTLISFDAKRSGANTLISWATASEISNSGFQVQVSTDGTNFRKLAFVASEAINSSKKLNYSYLDEESGKSGIRYYRLRQIDQDGSDDFSPVRAVDFSTAAGGLATALSAYPNPYSTSDALKLSVQTISAGAAHLRVTDLVGRTVANQTFTTVNGVTEIALDQAANLSAGSYVAQVTLPSGEVKTVRIQKH